MYIVLFLHYRIVFVYVIVYLEVLYAYRVYVVSIYITYMCMRYVYKCIKKYTISICTEFCYGRHTNICTF